MARLPQPGSDNGVWGDILNDFLSVAHASDGTVKDSSITSAKLNSSGGSDGNFLAKNSGAPGGLAWQVLNKSAVGLANVDNTSDAAKPVSTAQQTALDGKTDTSVTSALDTRVVSLESPGILALTDAATIATDAAAGKHFRVTITADRTLGVPTNPTDGMHRIWEVTASGANRNLTLTTGSSGAFELTTNITSPITILSGKTHFVGAIYNASRARWTVLASRATS